MFDWVSFTIGGLVFSIIILLVIWITYYTRTFIFQYCATQPPYCTGIDYYNNPGNAIANGADVDDILFINNQNEMFYKRVPRTDDCIPQSNQVIPIQYPQYCEFETAFGMTGTWKQTFFTSNVYRPADGSLNPTVTTTGNCIPAPGSFVVNGKPLLQWDPTPIND